MELNFFFAGDFSSSRQQIAASALAESGFSRWTRQKMRGETAVLTHHGLRRDGAEPGTLDASLHETEAEVCAHLSQHYEVVSFEQAVRQALKTGSNAKPKVAIT